MARPVVLAIVALIALGALAARGQQKPEKPAAEPAVPFEAAVDQAVERGVQFLLARQDRDGSWGAEHAANETQHDLRYGQTAFAMYTLLACGVPAQHPAIVPGLAYLERE